MDDNGVVSDTVVADSCNNAGFAVNVEDGTVVVGTDTGIAIIGSDGGITAADTEGSLVARDEVADVWYTGAVDSPIVKALEDDGSERWMVDLNSQVVKALTDAGAQGACALSVENPDKTGAILYLDGETGVILASIDTPTAAKDIEVSADGRTVALVIDSAVHFYTLAI